MKLRYLLGPLGLFGLLVVGFVVSAAVAAPPGAYTCSGGVIPAGTYNGLTVAAGSTCAFTGTVQINGNLSVEDGAILNDHAGPVASVHVTGNVKVGKGAVLGLGSYNPAAQQVTVVDGNVQATQPGTLYLSFMTIRGNLTSNGGGDPERNFPIKDITIAGNLICQHNSPPAQIGDTSQPGSRVSGNKVGECAGF
jgi:phage baseplate assembly protein gpV